MGSRMRMAGGMTLVIQYKGDDCSELETGINVEQHGRCKAAPKISITCDFCFCTTGIYYTHAWKTGWDFDYFEAL